MSKEKTKILLVEDDLNLGFVIKDGLDAQGYKVSLFTDGKSAYQAFFQQSFDLCVFDVMLPKKDGFSLAEDIRQINKNTPIVFLTAKAMQEDRIRGFKAGGDDYITKPFSMEEFILRIEAILKRCKTSGETADQKHLFQLGNFSFDYNNLTLASSNKSQTLTRKEADILRLLCMNQNEVLKREVALNIVWGNDDYFLGRSMDVFITKLRKYLKDDTTIKINNVHGVGFKLTIEQ